MNLSISRNGYLAPRRVDLFSEVSKELDQAMNNIFGHDFFTGLSKKGRGYPLMDAIRTENKLILQYTVPGVKLDDLIVELSEDGEGRLLTVGGFLHEDYLAKNEQYQIKELSSQEFRRVIRLPSDLSEKEPLANLKDGILTLSFDLIKSTSETNTKTKKLKITEG
jgi:HSP20 family molecular chaperone IbpA